MSTRGHVLVVLVTVASILFIIRLLRRNQLRPKYALLWLSTGAVAAVVAVFPGLLDRVSIWLGVSYGPTTFFLMAVTLLFLVVIHFSWELSRLEDRTRVLAEELALLKMEAANEERAAHGSHRSVRPSETSTRQDS